MVNKYYNNTAGPPRINSLDTPSRPFIHFVRTNEAFKAGKRVAFGKPTIPVSIT